MKRLYIVWIMLLFTACHRTMETCPSDGEGRDVNVSVTTRNSSEEPSSSWSYRFFLFDSTGRMITCNINPQGKQMRLKLSPGTYSGYCITNATADECWEYDENATPEEIYLKVLKNKSSYEEAGDYQIGYTEFTVQEDATNSVTFELKRVVAMLKVIIEHFPEQLNDLKINISDVPQKMNLKEELSDSCMISKNAAPPDKDGISTTCILLFPSKKEASLSLSSENWVFTTEEHLIDSMSANRTTEIRIIFHDLFQIDVSTRLAEWNTTVLKEEDWDIDMPLGPCTGEGNGVNLVLNGGFEGNFADSVPEHWALETAVSNNYPKVAALDTTTVHEGKHSVRIEGKTYIYQDITVEGGRCYELHLWVNAPDEDAKWKYEGTWMNGKQKLESSQICTSNYQKKNNGYTDVYGGRLFRAPEKATKLRIEVKNYSNPVSGRGIYIDDVRVEAVD